MSFFLRLPSEASGLSPFLSDTCLWKWVRSKAPSSESSHIILVKQEQEMVFCILGRPTDACSPRKGLMGFSHIAELFWGKRRKKQYWQLLNIVLQLVLGGEVVADRGLLLNHTISRMGRDASCRDILKCSAAHLKVCSTHRGAACPGTNSSASLFLPGLPFGGLLTPAAWSLVS